MSAKPGVMLRFSFSILRTFLLAFGVLCLTMPIDAQDVLGDWMERQSKIKRVIETVSPCVVAIEGGCGVIISERGHVLTVSHVSGAADRQVKVQFADGSFAIGTTLGSNPNFDVSVVKLDGAGKWPHIAVPDLSIPSASDDASDEPKIRFTATRLSKVKPSLLSKEARLKKGAWCVAFGYPLSFKRGHPPVVRLGQVQSVSNTLIRASAMIMGGDSGGALVDLDGQLIGISSRVRSQADANLYVPIQVYRDQWEKLLAGVVGKPDERKDTASERSMRPWLGIFGDTDESRVRVRRVQAGSPADDAGLKPEDVIVMFDNVEMTKFSDVVEQLKRLHPGDKIAIEVNRYGTLTDLTVELGAK